MQQQTAIRYNTTHFEHNLAEESNSHTSQIHAQPIPSVAFAPDEWVVDYEAEQKASLAHKEEIERELVDDFTKTYNILKEKQIDVAKKHLSSVVWIKHKSFFSALFNQHPLASTLFVLGLILPFHFLIPGVFAGYVLWNTARYNTDPNSNYQKLLQLRREKEMEALSKLPAPDLLNKFLEDFVSFPINLHQIQIIDTIIQHVPDHPVIKFFAKAYKGQQHGLIKRMDLYEFNNMLYNAQETMGQLKDIQDIKEQIQQIKKKNPSWKFPPLEHDLANQIMNNLSESETPPRIPFLRIYETATALRNYYNQLQEIGLRELNLD